IDPHEARVRATRRAPPRRYALPAVGGAIDRGARQVDDVGILRIRVDLAAGARQSLRAERPRLASIIRSIESTTRGTAASTAASDRVRPLSMRSRRDGERRE